QLSLKRVPGATINLPNDIILIQRPPPFPITLQHSVNEQFRLNGQYPYSRGRDVFGCGWYDDPCASLDFALDEISYRLGNYNYIYPLKQNLINMEVKTVMIAEGGYDNIRPFQMSNELGSPSIRSCDRIWLMKEHYGSEYAYDGQAEIVMRKNNDILIEGLNKGWMEAVGGIRLDMSGINITADDSTLNIPAVYVQGPNSKLYLQEIIFRQIKLSPQTLNGAKGIVHIFQADDTIDLDKTLFEDIIIDGAGGSGLRIVEGGSVKTQLKMTQFHNITSLGDSQGQGGAGIFAQIGDNGHLYLENTHFTHCVSQRGDGGATFITLTDLAEFKLEEEISFQKCESINTTTNGPGGRGGGVYLQLTGLPIPHLYNFMFGENIKFIDNGVGICGRDIFIKCPNIEHLQIYNYIQFSVDTKVYNRENAIYGSETQIINDLWHKQLVDYDLLVRFDPYYSDTIYIADEFWAGLDVESCGRLQGACSTFAEAKRRILTQDWTYNTVPKDNIKNVKINRTFVIVHGMDIDEEFASEADIITFRGITVEEVSIATSQSELRFGVNGQLVYSDLALWQQTTDPEQQQMRGMRGMNQSVTLQNLRFVLPDTSQKGSIVKLVGVQGNKDQRRFVELTINNCVIFKDSPINIGYPFLNTAPFATRRMNISLIQVQASNIQLLNTALLEIRGEPQIIQAHKFLNMDLCQFNNIQAAIDSNSLIETQYELKGSDSPPSEVPFGAASVLNLRGTSAILLSVYMADCSFENCLCDATVRTENKFIGVGGAVAITGKSLHVQFEHVRFSNDVGTATITLITPQKYQIELGGGVYIGLVGGCSGEEKYTTQKAISDFLREEGNKTQDLSRHIDDISHLEVIFDLCMFGTCRSTITNNPSLNPFLETGGAFVHIVKSQIRCDFQSSIFSDCSTTNSGSSQSTNIALVNSLFEPLWDRETGLLNLIGCGLIVAHGNIPPLFKASGIQFVNCDALLKDITSTTTSIQVQSNFVTSKGYITYVLAIKFRGGQ
ncbi:MAG: hypothetical protein EZS28_031594, partial [Streblomastix strix]